MPFIKTPKALKQVGFGVLIESGLKVPYKKILDVNFYNYRMVHTCNPSLAHNALQTVDKTGPWFPCHVIVQEWSRVLLKSLRKI